MAASITTEYFPSTGTTMSCNLSSLANGAYEQSTAIDNTSNLYFDALVSCNFWMGITSAATATVVLYAYASVDNGSTYTDGASGTVGAMTPTSPTNLKQIGVINCPTSSTNYFGGPFSVAAAFGFLPDHWGIVAFNNSGTQLSASASVMKYEGLQTTSS